MKDVNTQGTIKDVLQRAHNREFKDDETVNRDLKSKSQDSNNKNDRNQTPDQRNVISDQRSLFQIISGVNLFSSVQQDDKGENKEMLLFTLDRNEGKYLQLGESNELDNQEMNQIKKVNIYQHEDEKFTNLILTPLVDSKMEKIPAI